MGVVWYNGVPSTDMGIIVEHPPSYQIPARDYEVLSIPGRNGDIFVDKGTYKNTPRTYDIAIAPYQWRSGHQEEWATIVQRVSKWLHSGKSNYCRLEDSYDPDCYRLAVYEESVTMENILNTVGRTTLTFNCKPQRFFKVGDEPITLDFSTITDIKLIENPTDFISLPILSVTGREHGSGVILIRNDNDDYNNVYRIEIRAFPYLMESSIPVVINSDIQDVYAGATGVPANWNSLVVLENGFPKLTPGRTTITASGDILSVEVIPKWWKL